jgi:DNA-binding response OmpR family regulator
MILDVMMPIKDGFPLLQKSEKQISIFQLFFLPQTQDVLRVSKVEWLSSKPFSMEDHQNTSFVTQWNELLQEETILKLKVQF